MNSVIPATILFAIAAMLWSPTGNAAEPPALENNPFSRPPSAVTIPARRAERLDGPVQELDLRATIVTTRSRLANVAGRTLRPGEEVQGYTLVQVFEDRAVFAGHGKQLTIYVKPDADEDDDQGRRN